MDASYWIQVAHVKIAIAVFTLDMDMLNEGIHQLREAEIMGGVL